VSSHKVVIVNGKLYLTAKGLSDYFNVTPPTITAYKKKGLEAVQFDGDKTQYFEVKQAEEIKQFKVKDKYSQSGEVDLEQGDKDLPIFPDGRRFFQMNINDPEDLEMIALHPLGEVYLDRVEAAETIKNKQHALQVKKGEYLLMSELNMALAEVLALIKSSLVSIRDQLPVSQVEKLITEKLIKKDDKQTSQKVIADEADSTFKEMFEDIDKALLKRTSTSKSKIINFLNSLLSKYED